jgi:hypothetical protein
MHPITKNLAYLLLPITLGACFAQSTSPGTNDEATSSGSSDLSLGAGHSSDRSVRPNVTSSPLSYSGGWVGPLNFQPVYWGNGVAPVLKSVVGAPLQAMLDDANLTYLSEYAVSTGDPSHGNSLSAPTGFIAFNNTATSVSDNDVAVELEQQFGTGHLQFQSNTVYVVLLPPGIADSSGPCGDHFSFLDQANGLATVPVIVIPDNAKNCDSLTQWQNASIVLDHEVVETLTDPYPNSGWDGPGGGSDEIGDKCQPGPGQTPPSTVLGYDGIRYWGQRMWSNRQGQCVTGQANDVLAVVSPRPGGVALYWSAPDMGLSQSYWNPGQNWTQDQEVQNTAQAFEPGDPVGAAAMNGVDGSVRIYAAAWWGGVVQATFQNGWNQPVAAYSGRRGPVPGAPVTAINAKEQLLNGANTGTIRFFWVSAAGGVEAAYQGASGNVVSVEVAGPHNAFPGAAVAAVVTKPGAVTLFWATGDALSEATTSIATASYDCGTAPTCSVTNGSWSKPSILERNAGIPRGAPIAAVSSKPGGEILFWTRTDGTIASKFNDPTNGGWNPMFFPYGTNGFEGGEAAVPGQTLAAVTTATNEVSVFWVGQDASIVTGYFDPVSWSWKSPTTIASAQAALSTRNTQVSAISLETNQISLYWEGVDGSAQQAFTFDPGGPWSGVGPVAPGGAVVP